MTQHNPYAPPAVDAAPFPPDVSTAAPSSTPADRGARGPSQILCALAVDAAQRVVGTREGVHSSPSMMEELLFIQGNLKNFATFIGTQSIDYHVIMISAGMFMLPLCVPQPLGRPDCTNGPRHQYIYSQVKSDEALIRLVEHQRLLLTLKPR